MQLSVSLTKLSLGLGILAICVGTATAQSLTGATAQLITPLNSQTAKVGQPVTAKLDGSVKIANGEVLRKGTELDGNISEVKAADGHSVASLSVVFTTAELRNGRKIQIKATLLGAYPPNVAEYSDGGYDVAALTPARVSAQYSVDQEPGVLRGISLNAAVADSDSGTFSKKSGNFRIVRGSYLQFGVAPADAGNTTSAAE